MRLAFVQLSDIHIQASNSIVESRAVLVAKAIMASCREVEHIIIGLTGDIAYSGKDTEYTAALDFVTNILDYIKCELPQAIPHVCMVPGNHDLDHTTEQLLREPSLEMVSKDEKNLTKDAIFSHLISPQKNYWSFENAVCGNKNSDSNQLFSSYSILEDGAKVTIMMLNSAVCSKVHEVQGKLYYPADAIKLKKQKNELVIAMMHHPLHWLSQSCLRKVASRIESVSDILVTGHEHFRDKKSVKKSKSDLFIVEAPVFFESGSTGDSSGFNIIHVNTSTSKKKVVSFNYEPTEMIYTPNSSKEDEDYIWEDLKINESYIKDKFLVNSKFKAHLADLGVSMSHKTKEKVSLEDVFVMPDLTKVTFAGDRRSEVIKGDGLINFIETKKVLMIIGDDQSGKSSLAKTLFTKMHEAGDVVLLVDGANCAADLSYETIARPSFSEQYTRDRYDEFEQLVKSRRVLIVDNFQLIRLNPKYKMESIQRLLAHFSKIILFSHDTEYSFYEAASAGELSAMDHDYGIYKILQFNIEKRTKLVERWFSIDRNVSFADNKTLKKIDQMCMVMNDLVGKSVLPAYPVYLLSIIQASEASSDIDTTVGSHGYMYELIIKNQIYKCPNVTNPNNIISYLAQFAYTIHDYKKKEIPEVEFERFHSEFDEEYEVGGDHHHAKRMFQKARLLSFSGGAVRFSYDYLYYYFVGCYFRDNINSLDVREKIQAMSTTMYLSDCSNILLFLAYLSKDPFIYECLINSAKKQFIHEKEIRFESDLAFLNKLQAEVQKISIPEKQLRVSRHEEISNYSDTREIEDNFREADQALIEDGVSILSKINASLKTINVLGQFLKNHPASVKKVKKDELIAVASGLARRALSCVINAFQNQQDEVLVGLMHLISLKRSFTSPDKLRASVVTAVVSVCEAWSFGIIQRLSMSLGSQDLIKTFDRILFGADDQFLLTLYAALQLDYYPDFPVKSLLDFEELHGKNPFVITVLRQLILRHFNLYSVGLSQKKVICEKFKFDYIKQAAGNPSLRISEDE